MEILNSTLDYAFGKDASTLATTFSKDSSAIVNSGLDVESQEYHPTPNKLKKIDIGKELNAVESISKPIETKSKPSAETQHFIILQQSLDFFTSFGYILGIEISFDWKPNPRYYFMELSLAFIWSQIFYTQFLHIKNSDYYKLLEVFACYGVTLSMLFKLWVFLASRRGANSLFNSTKKICKLHSSGFRATKIRDRLQENFKFYKLTAFVVILSICIFVAYPAKAFIMDGEFIPLLPLQFMLVDQSTLSGFLLANVLMALLGIMANCATVFCILVVVATVFNYSVLVDMVEEDINSLDNMWSGNSDTTVQYRRLYLRNICRKQQDMDEYVKGIKQYLDVYIYIYFCANYFSQIICLFQIVVSDWKSGYAIAYIMFLEMMFYCFMGTKLSSENERMLSVLQQSKWYSYDLHSQRIFSIMYLASLNAKILWIGPIAPLTVYTGTDIVKSIYSYFNLMLEFV